MALIKLLIDEVDYTGRLLEEEWSLSDNEGDNIDTVEVVLDDPDKSITITMDKDLVVEKAGDALTRYFGGIVAEVVAVPVGNGRTLRVIAQDWKILLDSYYIAKAYNNQTDKAIIQDAFTEAGLTEIDTSGISESRVLDNLGLVGFSLRQVMATVSGITGFFWDVDHFKKLVYRPHDTVAAAFALSDTPDEVSSFPFWGDLRHQVRSLFNSVEVHGGRKLKEVTDTYSGDGVRKEFNLQIDGIVAGRTYQKIFRGPEGADPDLPTFEKNIESDGVPVWEVVASSKVVLEFSFEADPAADQIVWNPLVGKVIWGTAPPNFSNNSWRITGRYFGSAIWKSTDFTAVGVAGRTFTKIITEPSVETDDQAKDVADAFLREQGAKDQLSFRIKKDGLKVGDLVKVTSSIHGFVVQELEVKSLNFQPRGGSFTEYAVVAATGRIQTLDQILGELRRRAGSRDLTAAAALVELFAFSGDVAVAAMDVVTVNRGPTYFARSFPASGYRRNYNVNPGFEENLDNWTELKDAGLVGTTSRFLGDAASGDWSLDVDVVSSTSGSIDLRRVSNNVVAAESETWSVRCKIRLISIGGLGVARFGLRFQDSGGASLALHFIDASVVSATFVEFKVENKVAPANTASVRVELGIDVLLTGDVGRARFDEVLLEKAAAVGGYFDGYEGDGFWQGADNNSEAIKDETGDAMIAGYFVART